MTGDIITVHVNDLKPNPWNPNRQSEFIYEKEIESLRTHGQLIPILVRDFDSKSYEIIDGEHRWKAMRHLGWDRVTVNNLGKKITDETAKQLTLILNEVKGEAKADLLSDLLKDLEGTLGRAQLEKALPYTASELDGYLSEVNAQVEAIQVAQVPVQYLSPVAPKDKRETSSQREQNRQSGKDFSDGVVQSTEEHRTLFLKLPVEVAEQFQNQIDRINLLLFPDEKDPSQVLPTMAVQVICQQLSQIEDNKLL